MPVVAGQQGDRFHIIPGKAEDFTVENDILGMELVILLVDKRANIMQKGGNLQQKPVMLGKAVQYLNLLLHLHAQARHMLAVSFVRLVPVRQNPGEMENLRLQIPRMLFRTYQAA